MFLKEINHKMGQAIENMQVEFATLRAGRAHPALLDTIMINAYNSHSPLKQLASITAPDSTHLLVSVWDVSIIPNVEKAIRESELGVNPHRAGNALRITLPELSEERRKEIVKVAGRVAEQTRVAIRNIRRNAMDEIKKDESLSKDESHDKNQEIQKITDDHIKRVDHALEEKTKDILTV